MLHDEFPELLVGAQHHVGDSYDNNYTNARASFYGVGGIPDVRIDGKIAVVGAGSCVGAYNLYKDALETRMEETGGLSPAVISGDWSYDANNIYVTATFMLVDPVDLENPRASFMIVEDGVAYGPDNKHLTRAGYDTPVALDEQWDEVEVSYTFARQSAWNINNVAVLAFLQKSGGDKAVYQAAELPTGDPSISIFMADNLASIPAGNGLAEFEGTLRNIGSASDPVTFSLDNTFGWPAEFMVEGEAGFHSDPVEIVMAPDEELTFTVRVQTDGDVRIGTGKLMATSGNSGDELGAPMRLFNGSPAILMVDDDFTRTDEVLILSALDDAGKLYDHWDVYKEHGNITPTPAEMGRYDLVLWHTGWRTSDLLTSTDITNLMAYMDMGKGLLLSSQDCLSAISPGTFTSDYLGVASWSTEVSAFEGIGVSGDPVTDGMDFVLDYPQPQINRPDDLEPSAIGTVILHSEDMDRLAMRADNGTARCVFFAFAMNAMDPAAPDPDNPKVLLDRALDWLMEGQSQDVPGVVPELVMDSRIEAVEPNPFSPRGLTGGASTIRLSISSQAAADPVTLDLVDLNGRAVRRLVSGQLGAGPHNANWDGRDAAGAPVATGVYYLRLATSEGEHSQRLLVVR